MASRLDCTILACAPALAATLLALGCPPEQVADAAAAADAAPSDVTSADVHRRDVPAFDLDRDAGQRDALVAFDGRLESGALVPATSASFGADFRFNSAGRGTARVGDIAIGDNRTVLQLAGVDHVGLSWRQLDWSAAGYQLYFELTLASDGSDLAVSWLYCSDDAIDYVYSESFELPLAWEITSGTCVAQIVDQSVDVSLPPLLQMPQPFESGFSIQGSDIALAGPAGSIVVDGTSWALLPFETVDCSDCPGGPWYELHAMIHRSAEACFVILYLYPEKPEQIPLDYGICLPSLAQLDALYDAVWSGRPLPSSYRPGSAPGEPPMRPPPRRHAPVKP